MLRSSHPSALGSCSHALISAPLGTIEEPGAPAAAEQRLVDVVGLHAFVEYAPRAMQSRALVSATAGTTRDRIDGVAEWEGVRFRVQDTGGIFELDHENSEPSVLERAVAAQVDVAVSDAAVVLFTVATSPSS